MEEAVANGKETEHACRDAGIVEQTLLPLAEGIQGIADAQVKRLKELEQENTKLKRLVSVGKLLSPERRRQAVFHAQQKHGLGERWACRLVRQPRGTQRYRRVTALLVHPGWRGVRTASSVYEVARG